MLSQEEHHQQQTGLKASANRILQRLRSAVPAELRPAFLVSTPGVRPVALAHLAVEGDVNYDDSLALYQRQPQTPFGYPYFFELKTSSNEALLRCREALFDALDGHPVKVALRTSYGTPTHRPGKRGESPCVVHILEVLLARETFELQGPQAQELLDMPHVPRARHPLIGACLLDYQSDKGVNLFRQYSWNKRGFIAKTNTIERVAGISELFPDCEVTAHQETESSWQVTVAFPAPIPGLGWN